VTGKLDNDAAAAALERLKDFNKLIASEALLDDPAFQLILQSANAVSATTNDLVLDRCLFESHIHSLHSLFDCISLPISLINSISHTHSFSVCTEQRIGTGTRKTSPTTTCTTSRRCQENCRASKRNPRQNQRARKSPSFQLVSFTEKPQSVSV
jgi:hypothetical protein